MWSNRLQILQRRPFVEHSRETFTNIMLSVLAKNARSKASRPLLEEDVGRRCGKRLCFWRSIFSPLRIDLHNCQAHCFTSRIEPRSETTTMTMIIIISKINFHLWHARLKKLFLLHHSWKSLMHGLRTTGVAFHNNIAITNSMSGILTRPPAEGNGTDASSRCTARFSMGKCHRKK